MNIKPVRNFVAVVKEETPNKTSSGIYMPDIVESNIITGKVVAVGSGHLSKDGVIVPLEVHNGDKIIFDKSSSAEIKVNGVTVLMIREDSIICKVKELD